MNGRTRVDLACVLSFSLVTAAAAQDSRIVSGEARFGRLFTGGFFLESPAVAPDGSVFFSDITYSSRSGMQAGHIWRYDPIEQPVMG